ncbi:MAG: selenocysteine-specific translation elongation factor [Gammaproteobacteria bacterium]
MIIATAGHVDHGKTSLVRALTGVDTDRLPEERARGMTIDLGFAYLALPGSDDVVGFVDVPGHERFVRNMLAGVAGIDFALLVVAADDGPMPQTREHLAILDLLGIPHGAVALTKIDRVPPARLDAVAGEVSALLAPTRLAGSPVVPVCALDGSGIAELRDLLGAAARACAERAADGRFRLAIDRSFVLEGAGRVVTGTVHAGTANIGERLLIAPAGIEVRVRSIHAQNRAADTARAGQRCGINLAGLDLRRHAIHRGDWLVDPALATSATRLGVRLTLAAGEEKALKDRTPVHVHLGAADIGGRVLLLADRALAPGESCLAILALDAPVIAVRGDRVVLRDQSATRTLGGAEVLEALPYPRALTRTRRLPVLAALAAAAPAEALRALLAALPDGVDAAWFARVIDLHEDTLAKACATANATAIDLPKGERLLLDVAAWQAARDAVEGAVRRHHAAEPAQTGLPEAELTRAVAAVLPKRLLRVALETLVRDGRLVRRAGQLAAPDHAARLAPGEAALLKRVEAELRRHGLQAPALHDLPDPLKMKIEVLRPFMERMGHLGRLVHVAKYRYYLPSTLHALAVKVEELARAAEGGRFTAAEFRTHTGIGRNVTIEVLEYFDRVGLTQRYGEKRVLRRPAAEVFGPPP